MKSQVKLKVNFFKKTKNTLQSQFTFLKLRKNSKPSTGDDKIPVSKVDTINVCFCTDKTRSTESHSVTDIE